MRQYCYFHDCFTTLNRNDNIIVYLVKLIFMLRNDNDIQCLDNFSLKFEACMNEWFTYVDYTVYSNIQCIIGHRVR